MKLDTVSEVLLLASKTSADPSKVPQALMGSFAYSKIIEVHGERRINRTFDPGFRIELHRKDFNLVPSNARQLGVGMPITVTAQELCDICAAHGGADRDHSKLVRALEIFADNKVAL